MNFIRSFFAFFIIQAAVFAQIHPESMLADEIQGTYVLQDTNTQPNLSFEIRGSKVKVLKPYEYYNASLQFINLGNNWGNHPAPLAQVVISGGSDEDVYNIVLRFFLNKNKNQKSLTLIDAIETKSDGLEDILSYRKLETPLFKKLP